MRDTTVARGYAEALFEIGERHKAHDDFAAALEVLNALQLEAPQLRAFLASPKIEPMAKKDVLRKTLANRIHPLFINFLMVMINKRRQRLLHEVGIEYRNLMDERLGRLHVQVTVARAPDERMKNELTERLTAALGRQVIPHVTVNREILGGVVVRFGDRVLDGSLRRRLLSLRRRMLDATIPDSGPAKRTVNG